MLVHVDNLSICTNIKLTDVAGHAIMIPIPCRIRRYDYVQCSKVNQRITGQLRTCTNITRSFVAVSVFVVSQFAVAPKCPRS